MRHLIRLIPILVISLTTITEAKEPKIVNVKGKYRLQMNKAMDKALKELAPQFKQYMPEHYPNLEKIESIPSPYKMTDKQMLSAVIGDFNGDGKKDVVILGADEKGDVAYKIISQGKSYVASEFGKRFGQADKIALKYKKGAEWTFGMKYLEYRPVGGYFTDENAKEIKCPYESLSFLINADGTRRYPYCWRGNDLLQSVSDC